MPVNVNNPRAAEQLRREFDVLGDRINLRMDDTVVPVAVISDLTAGASGVPTVRRSVCAFTIAAVAGEFPVWRFETPPGSFCVINRIHVVHSANSLVRAFWGASFAVVPAGLAAPALMDGRLRAESHLHPAANVVYDTQIPAIAAVHRFLQANSNLGIDNVVEWVCGRTDLYDFIEFQAPTVNTTTTVSMEWDEFQIGQ